MAGDAVNDARADLPGAPANVPDKDDAARILGAIRDAKAHADLVVVYQHNHVFGNKSFDTIFSEGMPERLEPNKWLKDWTHAEVEAGADVIVMHGALTYISEPMSWESVVAYLEFQGKTLKSIALRPIALNYVGNGQPEIHNQYTSNEFLQTRGLPSPAEGAQARYILERLAEYSKPFGTKIVIGEADASIDLRRH
jgi:hypothetical protein